MGGWRLRCLDEYSDVGAGVLSLADIENSGGLLLIRCA